MKLPVIFETLNDGRDEKNGDRRNFRPRHINKLKNTEEFL